MRRLASSPAILAATISASWAGPLLIEAESFEDHGGWVLDAQFMDQMGSPYPLADELGKPCTFP